MSKEACELPLIQYKDKNGKTRTKPSRVFGGAKTEHIRSLFRANGQGVNRSFFRSL